MALLYRRKDDTDNIVRINVDKARNDKTGHIYLGWNGATTRFTDMPPHGNWE